MRGLDSVAAFRDAIYRAVHFGISRSICGCTLLLQSHWKSGDSRPGCQGGQGPPVWTSLATFELGF